MIPRGTKVNLEVTVIDANTTAEDLENGFALTEEEAAIAFQVMRLYLTDRGGLEEYITGDSIRSDATEEEYQDYLGFRHQVAKLYSFLELQFEV